MKKSVLNTAVLVLTVGALAACGKEDIPSCGDEKATSLVSQIVAESVWKDSGTLQDEFKKRVRFAVEQPIIVSYDEKAPRYTCKAVTTYKASDAVLESLHRADADKTYQAALLREWRRNIGVFSYEDVQAIAEELRQADTNNTPDKDSLRQELSTILGGEDSLDNQLLAAMAAGYPAPRANKEIQRNAELLTQILKSMDEKTKKLGVEVQYTISKIDTKGERQFHVEVASERDDLIEGIQNLEAMESAAQRVAEQAKAKSAAAPVAPAAAEAQSVAPAAHQAKPEPVARAPQAATDVKPQPAVEPEAKKATIEASFDCAKASAKIEKLICSTPETAAADKRLASVYAAARSKVTDQQNLKAEQMQWLKEQRNACTDAECLMKVTADRIQKLSAL